MRIWTKLVYVTALFFSCIYFTEAQTCTDCRYLAPLFDSVTVETVLYAEGENSDGQTQQLYMDIYQPYGDTLTSRPVMIFAFGGGFVQGSRNDWYVEAVCKYFAQAGYVTAAVDYRIGINPLEVITLEFMKIFFRPMQDMRAAVQYFKADYSELGNNYKVDTSKIILGGGSAGAITALMVSYCDKASEMAEMGDITILDDMGGFYSTSGFYDHYNWKPTATVNVSGALIDADWVEAGDRPLISLHGDADDVVPYKEGAFSFLQPFGFNLQGSYLVDSVARAKGVCSYLYTWEGQGHPSENKTIEYYKSLVNILMVRMHAVVKGRSFCCALEADIPGDTTYYQLDNPVTLNGQVSNDSGNAQLMWCGLPCLVASSSSSVTFSPDTALKQIAFIASEGQCQAGDINVMKESNSVGISTIDKPTFDFSISPNPADGVSTVSINEGNKIDQAFKIEIFDLAGKKVYRNTSSGNHLIRFNAKKLPAGNYMIKLSSGKHFLTKQLVITH